MTEESLPRIEPIEEVYLLHGKGGSPDGTVKRLVEVLEPRWPQLTFVRPKMAHSDPTAPAEASVEQLRQMDLPRNALMVGISLGGTVAAGLQELGRDDLHVIAVSSPTWADGVVLHERPGRRVALYSSRDDVIASRVADWPRLAAISRDFDWLTHNTDAHFGPLARLLAWYVEGNLTAMMNDDPLAEAFRL
jgi:pimeloyl-ACP methyl ester carboxylesterase